MASGAALYPPLDQRPMKNTLVLFDVDNTLTIPRQVRYLQLWQSKYQRTQKKKTPA